ncbi:HEWD family protein [Halovivax sp.]|uniref:HEWD family protein n=1 Tax=Halovivax sp. TaxID=1935978 RepID=UPI0025C6E72E|nr:HEWD family protein [Halovivax sp.]
MSNSATSTVLRTPHERRCERCDRQERWNANRSGWVLVRRDGEPEAGDPHCIHEWDIDGTFRPFVD